MPKTHKTRAGSLQFWPRKRARRILHSVNWGPINKEGLQGFICYKVGMISVYVKDNTNHSMTKNKRIVIPATILECPPLKIYSIRFYKDNQVIKDLIVGIDEDFAKAYMLTEKEIVELKKFALQVGIGDNNLVPMICTADNCILSKRCPMLLMKKPPAGKECPFERYVYNRWYNEYCDALAVDRENKVEREQIQDLVATDVLNLRANIVLGTEGFIMENPIAFNMDTGTVISRREQHVAMLIKEYAQNRKEKINKSFLATRETKAKAASALRKDLTEYLAFLREKGAKTKAVDAEVSEVKTEEKKPEENKDELF